MPCFYGGIPLYGLRLYWKIEYERSPVAQRLRIYSAYGLRPYWQDYAYMRWTTLIFVGHIKRAKVIHSQQEKSGFCLLFRQVPTSAYGRQPPGA